jgi:hypothetical protein
VSTYGPRCHCNTKGKYWHRLLQSLVEVIDEGGEILENLKKISLKYVYWTTQAWEDMEQKTLA